jgi:hypothetical protein
MVARVLAQVFPARKAFVQSVIDEGIQPASDFPFGPSPKDKLRVQSDRIVEYQTPPHSDGLGTAAWLQSGDGPIDGVAILLGTTPDLLLLTVRLPPGLHDLAPPIVRQTERDDAASSSKK